MAKAFYYPVNELNSATIQQGQYTAIGTLFDKDIGSITDEDRLTDQSIGTAITSMDVEDTIRVDLGSSVACDFVAIYITTAETDNLILYASDSSTDMATAVQTMSATFTANAWNVFNFASNTKRYWFLRASSGAVAGLTEMILGIKYTFGMTFDLNNRRKRLSGSDIIMSHGENEYSNKKRGLKKTWNWNWGNISSSMTTSLEAMETAIEVDRFKFIYDDETTKHWVRMTKPLDIIEVAPDRFSTPISLREQLI